MGESSTRIEYAGGGFDLAAVGQWVQDHIWLALLCIFIAFIFHLFRPGGFAEKYLEYRTRKSELDSKHLDDVRKLTDMFKRKYDRDDPFLPFDDGLDDQP